MTRDDARSLATSVLKGRGLDEDTIILELTPQLLDRVALSRESFISAMLEVLARHPRPRNESPGYLAPHGRGFAVALFLLLFVGVDAIAAQKLRLCRPNDVPCDPPAGVFVYEAAPVPFNAPVRFSRAWTEKGQTLWLFVKAGEPPRPCTAEAASDGASYERACRTVIGEEMFITQAFLVEDAPQ